MGSIRLYQSTANSLVGTVRRFTQSFEKAFQDIFYLAAFCEITARVDIDELRIHRGGGELVQYDEFRQEGGMRIEARNMSFTYPGASQVTLKDINLSVQPGETLAIVGFNGGGKTTLVKALMGLYEYSGTLLINNREASSYYPESLHQRTSCLFQDYAKYSMTLRENVGIGDVSRMDELQSIGHAIDLGGAEKILGKIGMEGKLNRHGVPNAADVQDEEIAVKQEEQRVDAGLPFPPPPSDVRRGGHGPRRGGGPKVKVLGHHLTGDTVPKLHRSAPIDQSAPIVAKNKILKASSEDEVGSGTALSGGQWQRVALSKAFLRADQADLVVFEFVQSKRCREKVDLLVRSEPSASLDPRAEAQLFQRIHALSTQGGRQTTTIYISHRFSTGKH